MATANGEAITVAMTPTEAVFKDSFSWMMNPEAVDGVPAEPAEAKAPKERPRPERRPAARVDLDLDDDVGANGSRASDYLVDTGRGRKPADEDDTRLELDDDVELDDDDDLDLDDEDDEDDRRGRGRGRQPRHAPPSPALVDLARKLGLPDAMIAGASNDALSDYVARNFNAGLQAGGKQEPQLPDLKIDWGKDEDGNPIREDEVPASLRNGVKATFAAVMKEFVGLKQTVDQLHQAEQRRVGETTAQRTERLIARLGRDDFFGRGSADEVQGTKYFQRRAALIAAAKLIPGGSDLVRLQKAARQLGIKLTGPKRDALNDPNHPDYIAPEYDEDEPIPGGRQPAARDQRSRKFRNGQLARPTGRARPSDSLGNEYTIGRKLERQWGS